MRLQLIALKSLSLFKTKVYHCEQYLVTNSMTLIVIVKTTTILMV